MFPPNELRHESGALKSPDQAVILQSVICVNSFFEDTGLKYPMCAVEEEIVPHNRVLETLKNNIGFRPGTSERITEDVLVFSRQCYTGTRPWRNDISTDQILLPGDVKTSA